MCIDALVHMQLSSISGPLAVTETQLGFDLAYVLYIWHLLYNNLQ